ncbi:MAG: STAS domain-containing protein [Streptosporangiaceae bacterium]
MTDEQRDISAYPGPLVVTMPEVVDSDNADRVAAKLHTALTSGHPTLIADLTTTSYCDTVGMRMLVRARRRAAELGTDLRLVVPDGAVLRMAELLGLDKTVPIYPDLARALPPPARGPVPR